MRSIRPANGAGSLHRPSPHRRDREPQMPKDEDPLSRREIALIKLMDRSGRARDSGVAAGARRRGRRRSPSTVPPSPPSSGRPGRRRSIASSARICARGAPPRPTPSRTRCSRGASISTPGGCRRPPTELQAFLADRNPAKRAALVTPLLADNDKYAEHWISFWNDLLRNEDGVTYFSETAGRKSITTWLLDGAQVQPAVRPVRQRSS